jgi:hypothetical protein
LARNVSLKVGSFEQQMEYVCGWAPEMLKDLVHAARYPYFEE